MDASKYHRDVRRTNVYTLKYISFFADECLLPVLNFGRQCYNLPNPTQGGVNQCAKETIEVGYVSLDKQAIVDGSIK